MKIKKYLYSLITKSKGTDIGNILNSASKTIVDELENIDNNHFPVGRATAAKQKALEDQDIGCHRYFYPGLNTLDYICGACPVSVEIST